jgi:teichuronic acid biosynthesis glycosyltransferase TuaH
MTDMALQTPGDSTVITSEAGSTATSVVVCSLEPWGQVRRRMRILVDEIVELQPSLEVLYVAPPLDVPHQLRQRRVPDTAGPRLEQVHPRIHVLRPRKWWPRAIGPFADCSLGRQVLDAVGSLGLDRPLLWVNDASYATFAVRTGWPFLYDITDDWLLAPLNPRERVRLMANESLLLERSEAVVVCSRELERSRGHTRRVHLIPNGVDVALFRTPSPRPADLPPQPVALYVGSLHDERLDVPLVVELATRRPDLHVVLVGPDSLSTAAGAELRAVDNIHLLGPRPYERIPAFMQHADVVIIPHLVNAFTESLDPIKAYECLAAGRPTVATPAAGFRELGPPLVVTERERFVESTAAALADAGPAGLPTSFEDRPVPSWRTRAEAMASVMDGVRTGAAER